MRASGTFTVASFAPAALDPGPAPVATGLPVGVAVMEKRYDGDVTGRSATVFAGAFDQQQGVGSYVALESFEGALNGAPGTFNFTHAATAQGDGRADEHFTIVAGSGTDELAGIRGAGGMAVDADGTHRIWFDYELD